MSTVLAFLVLALCIYCAAQFVQMLRRVPGAGMRFSAAGAGAIAAALIFSPSLTPEQIAERRASAAADAKAARDAACADADMHFVIATKFVRDRLKAPATADFPSRATSTAKVDDCRYMISGYVDSENGFGAMIRATWAVDLSLDPNSGEYTALQVSVQ